MAESILFELAGGLISKLGSLILDEIVLWWDLKDEFQKLNRSVSTIQAVLLHAEEQSIENPLLKHWLGLLRDAMYDAEDLLDEFSTEALRKQLMGGSESSKKVRLFFSSSNQLAFGRKMGHKVRELRQRFDEITAEKGKFHLEERFHVERERGFGSKGREQTHSSPPQVVIGRDHDRESTVEVLLSSDHVENVSVVSIVGFGGLGKTTLAQLVYNDDRVQKHFDLKMWVCVSDDFDVKLLVKKVLGSQNTETEMEPLKNDLHGKINGRRYLLVLDDVWNENVNKWLSFKDLFSGCARGSKILITTRLADVAKVSRSIFVHELRGLSANEAWSLFREMAFKQGQPPNPTFE